MTMFNGLINSRKNSWIFKKKREKTEKRKKNLVEDCNTNSRLLLNLMKKKSNSNHVINCLFK